MALRAAIRVARRAKNFQHLRQLPSCRYTGPSLADFLQSLLDIADLRLRSRQAEQEGQGQFHRRQLREEPEKEEIPAEQEPLIPDLLYMGPDLGESMKITDDPETHPRDYHPSTWNLTQFHAAGLMVSSCKDE